MRVMVSAQARRDLVEIHRYIAGELMHPQAADRILASIRDRISQLERSPDLGRPLSADIPVPTAYRSLLCEHYRIFYVHTQQQVTVIRVLHQRQDYMKHLFGP